MKLDIGLMTFDLPAIAGYARRAEELAGGAQPIGALPHRLHLPRLDHGGAGRHRGGAAPAGASGEAADRHLRLHPDLSAGAGHTRETLDLFAVSGPFEEIGDRIRERYRGLYDRTQLYPSFQPPLDDPRWRTVLSGVERA